MIRARTSTTPPLPAALLLAGLVLAGGVAHAQRVGGHFPQTTGEAIFTGVCQGCHMPGGRGAIGAGAYPALARNAHLRSANYPALVILNGQRAMPRFGDSFSDAQIAAVVNYVRSRFGNAYKDTLTEADVKSLRSPPAAEDEP
jgi:mono/diheme cytochrome c family protein